MRDFQIYILIYFCLFNLVTAEEVVLQYPQNKYIYQFLHAVLPTFCL